VVTSPGEAEHGFVLARVPGSVIMQPTTLCRPLDCRYCYLPSRGVDRRMAPEVARAVAGSVNVWAAGAAGFEVVWHGGEPLSVGRDGLATLMGPFEGVRHAVQTNGVLIDDAWCDFFAARGVAVGVSLDGPERMNGNRVTLAGHPSHGVAVRGIRRLAEHGLPFSAIAVVSEPAPEDAGEFYEFFARLGCHTLGVNVEEHEGVHVRAGGHDPGRAREFWAALTEAWMRDPVVTVREVGRVLGYAAGILAVDRAQGGPETPAAWDPLPTIAYDGGVVLLSPELAGFTDARFGDFTTGNVLRDDLATLLAEADERTPWLAEFRDGVSACRASCGYFGFCGGGHAANRYFEHGGRLDGTRTDYCATARIALFEGVTSHVRTLTDHRRGAGAR
jgi:uncharacterized protein